MRFMLCALAFGLMASTAAAQSTLTPPPAALTPSAEASRDPADAPAGAYQLDPRHVSVIWRIRHTGLGLVVGRFDMISGTLMFDPAAPANLSVDVTIDPASVSTGVREGDGSLRFDAQIASLLGATPIRFVSRAATTTEPARGLVEGELTLNGQTHPVTLDVTFQGGRFVAIRGKHALGFSARTIIDRRQWGVGSLIFNQFAGDEVEILIEGEWVKE